MTAHQHIQEMKARAGGMTIFLTDPPDRCYDKEVWPWMDKAQTILRAYRHVQPYIPEDAVDSILACYVKATGGTTYTCDGW